MTISSNTRQNLNPLSEYPIFKSSNIEEAHDLISKNFSPHSLNILSCQQNLSTQYDGIFFNNMALLCSTYGADVAINPEANEYFFTQTTLTGSTEIMLGRQVAQTSKGSTVVLSPSANYQMQLHRGSCRLMTMFDRATLEHKLSLLLNRHLKKPLVFHLNMEESEQRNHAWSRSLLYLCDQLTLSNQLLHYESFLQHSSDMLMSLLLEMQPHNYSELLRHDPVVNSPRHVRRAIAYIEENIEHPISLAELSSAVGATARTLQKGFIRYTDSTPSEYIRSVRMRAIHEALLKPYSEQQVSEILWQYGITSFGHFARAYKAVYGCTPCETHKKN